LLTTLLVSRCVPMRPDVQERVDAFHRRLATPIGQLDEDHVGGSAAFSPFGIVGVCVLCIGLMLLAVLPWAGGGMTFGLTLGFGLALAAIGGLMAAMSRAAAARRD